MAYAPAYPEKVLRALAREKERERKAAEPPAANGTGGSGKRGRNGSSSSSTTGGSGSRRRRKASEGGDEDAEDGQFSANEQSKAAIQSLGKVIAHFQARYKVRTGFFFNFFFFFSSIPLLTGNVQQSQGSCDEHPGSLL
jgi:hypothetical protein